MINSHKDVKKLKGDLECEKPNNLIHKFEGKMNLAGVEDTLSLSVDNLILRGSSLRNTEEIYGLVVFAGHDTKLMKNNASANYKFSDL